MRRLLLSVLLYIPVPVFLLMSCGGQNESGLREVPAAQRPAAAVTAPEAYAYDTVRSLVDQDIRCIFQDKQGVFWFGTNADGVFRYDGKNLVQFTVRDGLCSNQVRSICEDSHGNTWIGTDGKVSRFDGQRFTSFGDNKRTAGTAGNWKTEPGDLWFGAGPGLYRSNDDDFTYLPLPGSGDAADASGKLTPYNVYALLQDNAGEIWAGTQSLGVCHYDGKSFTWINGKGLDGPAVLAIFRDKAGLLWFGNNGAGLFRYDGKTLVNFTAEKGLSNAQFLQGKMVSAQDGMGTLARIYSINEDNDGRLWAGTIDAGAWRYDGEKLVNYTMKDGLPGNSVTAICKDRNGELWFGTTAGVCKFNGTGFTPFVVKLKHQ